MGEPVIVSDPKVMGSGESIEQVLESHPRLTHEAILAALRFAAQALRAEAVYPAGTQSA